MTVELFEPYPLQKEFIDNYILSDTLIGVVAAPRGAGKTLLGINMMLFWALDKPERQLGWISPIYSQARNVFDQIVDSSEAIIKSSNRMELVIKFVNDSTIKFLSADSPDSIRGFRFSHIVLDEAAFMKERTIDQHVMPTLNPSGQKMLMISTPKGKNHFFKYFNRDSSFSMRFPLTKCPYVMPEVIGEAKKSLPPDLFKQEFESAFIDSSNDVFVGIDQVSTVNEYDLRKQDVFVGIDTGLTGDMSVVTLINSVGKVVFIDNNNKQSINLIADRFKDVLSRYNIVGGFIECNGIGRAMYDLIQPFYRKIKAFTMTQDSKMEMVRKLIHDVETLTIELPNDELCPELHREFSEYSYKLSTTGKLSFGHIPGGHDDYIDSLMLANFSRVKFMDRKPIRVVGLRNTQPMFKSPQ
tara:strand:- start:1346 stop:2581 length:1236 start_codon:yes stop_codon:yes gene_type:complete